MPATPNLEYAYSGGFLWPSIADALDTFLRRRHNNADPYERVWRLIHLWEAIEITLALAVMARLIGESASEAILRRQREFFYGKTWDISLDQFKSMQGAKDGGIDQWISILDEITKLAEPQGKFLRAVKTLLTSTEMDMAPLLTSWSKACDVPPEYKREKAEMRTAMRYVNSFRNRLALVPFPHDPLGEVADALEAATEQLFSVAPLPSSHAKDGTSSALTGAFRTGRLFLHGGNIDYLSESQSDEIQFVFPCRKKSEDNEVWLARPMLHLDSMMRSHLLTRVKGHDFCEYTRFRAEANAVVGQPNGVIVARLPEPSKSEYVTKAEAEVEVQMTVPSAQVDPTLAPPVKQGLTRQEAIEAIRSEDYEPAIEFFTKLTQQQPGYHVGWLRLGYAQREWAVRKAQNDNQAAVDLLKQAVQNFTKATDHKDIEHRALAWYERSKAWFHRKRKSNPS